MKKVMNHPEHLIDEMLEGYLFAFGADYEKSANSNGIYRKDFQNKVAVITGGGSGHEPFFLGFVGEGLAAGAAIGNVFAAPSPNTILDVTNAVECGKGVLYVYGNYSGDVLNFDMAAELAELEGIKTKTVIVADDIASASKERKGDRRGIAGDLFVLKIAGAAAEKGLNLQEVASLAQQAAEATFSIGVALSPGTLPTTGYKTFELADDEIEFGLGIHGEPGIRKEKLLPADELVEIMGNYLIEDADLKANDEVCLLINGLGSTTLMELFIVNRKITSMLKALQIQVHDTDINSYCTTQEMGGFSISILKVNDELKELYDAPAYSPYYAKRRENKWS